MRKDTFQVSECCLTLKQVFSTHSSTSTYLQVSQINLPSFAIYLYLLFLFLDIRAHCLAISLIISVTLALGVFPRISLRFCMVRSMFTSFPKIIYADWGFLMVRLFFYQFGASNSSSSSQPRINSSQSAVFIFIYA